MFCRKDKTILHNYFEVIAVEFFIAIVMLISYAISKAKSNLFACGFAAGMGTMMLLMVNLSLVLK